MLEIFKSHKLGNHNMTTSFNKTLIMFQKTKKKKKKTTG